MLRNINIAKCIYILAYVTAILSNAQFTANETDQSIAVQTEKIINIHDVSQAPITTQTSTPSSTFMNERSNENGTDNGYMNEPTILSTKSNDNPNAFTVDVINGGFTAGQSNGNDRTKLFLQDFDFNLDDLEDLNYHKKETFEGDDAEDTVTDGADETTKFEELTLGEESQNDTSYKVIDDNVNQQNVYRVAKTKSKPSVNSFIRNSTSEYRPWTDGSVKSFQIFTEMYDQFRWNIENIVNNISNKCGLDMQIYLNALNNEAEWALKGNC